MGSALMGSRRRHVLGGSQGTGNQLVRLLIGIVSKSLFNRPLSAGLPAGRLSYTDIGAPGMFRIKQDIMPGIVETVGRITGGIQQGPERVGLGQLLRIIAVQRRLRRR